MTVSRIGAGVAIGMVFCGVAQAAVQFAPAVNYSTGSVGGPGPAAEAMVAADLNNDGAPDILAADWWGSGVRSFLNDGSGGFGTAIVTALGTSTGSVSAAGFDGDGILDAATATGMELISLRGNGDGTFAEVQRQTLTVGGQVQAYTWDANGDGHVDVVAPAAEGVRVFFGQGDGQFVAGPVTTVGGVISAAARGNFNGDGIPDLALADGSGQRVIVMKGNGDGTFTQIASVFVGFIPEDVAAGDLNGDGRDDLATADSFSFSMSVVLSTAGGGYSGAQRYFGLLGPVSLRMADFDGDGDLDVAIPTVLDSKVKVYPNSGYGTLGTPLSLSTTNQPQTPAIADYNGDGKPDIAVAGPGAMSVLINTSP